MAGVRKCHGEKFHVFADYFATTKVFSNFCDSMFEHGVMQILMFKAGNRESVFGSEGKDRKQWNFSLQIISDIL